MRHLYPFAAYPWVRVGICFLPGIWLGRYYTEIPISILFGFLWFVWFLIHLFFKRQRLFIPETGLLLLICAFSLGWYISGQWHRKAAILKRQFHHQKVEAKILITSFPTTKDGKKWTLRGDLVSIAIKGFTYNLDCGIYLNADSSAGKFKPGSVIMAQAKLYAVSDTASGFQQYLYGIGVWFTGRAYELAEVSDSSGSLYAQALKLAAWAKDQLYTYIPDKGTAGLATALVTGDRCGLDKELANQYKQIGVTHILSVSGLHVGLICLILVRIFSVLDKVGTRGRVVRISFVLVALGVYAFVTGLAPSVCRAVVMSVISLIGQAFNRKSEGENTLVFTCVVELAWEPCWLFYPGFQLSFAALAGLIWILPMIEDLWEPDNPKVAKIWEMASTAIAAQISTLPFLIPLATDFPVYFLPANLLIVPLASLLTGGAFALVLLSPVPWIPDVLGWGIEWITWVMNQIARLLSILPGVSIPIPIHEVWQAWILGCVILILVFVLHVFRKPKG